MNYNTLSPQRLRHLALITQLIIFGYELTIGGGHVYTNSFPTYDEYDYSILDPDHIYGSPYGGFSRAARSRLASLPLFLPDVSGDATNENPLHMEVRDAEGRLFVCRVYHEEELDPESLHDSMYDAPKLRMIETDTMMKESSNVIEDVDESIDKSSVSTTEPKVDRVLQIQDALSELDGICAQVDTGWWSYEICFGKAITQFHIEVDIALAEYSIRDVTSLGDFVDRIIEPFSTEDYVVDIHDGGTLCPDTNQPRKTFIGISCCSDQVTTKGRGLIHRDGQQLSSEMVAVLDITEDPKRVCTYNISVCTPLLCIDDITNGGIGRLVTNDENVSIKPKENETIQEILDRALKLCIQTTVGWWSYEICHKQQIRQYHQAATTRRNEMGALLIEMAVETEHVLGRFQEDSIVAAPWGEERSIVVNSTAVKHIDGGSTYYEIEYIGGDFCDHSDVTDSAIVAGAAGSGGLARASSVRYFCGPRLDVAVNEDSTCHYTVEVAVPDLCVHPLFIEPVSQRRIVKCLPAD